MKRLDGGALMYSIMIMLIVSGLLGSILLLNGFMAQYETRLMKPVWARQNLYSGVNQFLDQGFDIGSSSAYPLFEEGVDSFQYWAERWGMLGLLHGKGIYGKGRYEGSCLIGQRIPAEQAFSLWVADRGSPLAVAGQVQLGGKLYLPSAGLRPAYLEGKAYQGPRSWEGVHASKSLRLNHSWESWNGISQELADIRGWEEGDQVFELSDLAHHQAWKTPSRRWESSSTLILHDLSLSGKCLIKAKEIVIDPSARLQDVLLFAEKIQIKAGVSGQFQAFALEEIQVEGGVRLSYPSLLAVLPDKQEAAHLHVEEGAYLEAQLFFSRKPFETQAHIGDLILMEVGSEIWGTIYSSQAIDLRASLHGRLICQQVVYQTPTQKYLNYLVDPYIMLEDVSPDYLGILSYLHAPYRVLKWIN